MALPGERMNNLAIDIGGTHSKFLAQSSSKTIRIASGPKAVPELLMRSIIANTGGWTYDHVSIGFPGPVLFLELGTGLGSAMVVDGMVEAINTAHLPWTKERTYEDYLGLRGLKRLGKHTWMEQVCKAIKDLRSALECETVVLGGGNASREDLPKGVRLGSNANVFKAAFRLSKEPDMVSKVGVSVTAGPR